MATAVTKATVITTPPAGCDHGSRDHGGHRFARGRGHADMGGEPHPSHRHTQCRQETPWPAQESDPCATGKRGGEQDAGAQRKKQACFSASATDGTCVLACIYMFIIINKNNSSNNNNSDIIDRKNKTINRYPGCCELDMALRQWALHRKAVATLLLPLLRAALTCPTIALMAARPSAL